ncbi:hypothetical protein G7046_g6806 [Stylonectria norvegica]|nr:hypothetical protein G7046_g6806 [Stylonectria norvegica]
MDGTRQRATNVSTSMRMTQFETGFAVRPATVLDWLWRGLWRGFWRGNDKATVEVPASMHDRPQKATLTLTLELFSRPDTSATLPLRRLHAIVGVRSPALLVLLHHSFRLNFDPNLSRQIGRPACV